MKKGKLFATYEISGADSFFLIQKLQEKGVSVYDITFLPQKIILSIDFAESEKLFAISRNMCYNITRVKYYGKVSPFKFLLSKVGLVLCFCVFLATSVFFDGLVTKIIYRGEGEVLAPTVNESLTASGVKLNSLLSADLSQIALNIYSQNKKISFITLQKSGRTIIAEAYLAKDETKPIDLRKENLVSPTAGVVTGVNVLSGTPLVAVGDRVEKGTALIGGYYLSGEKKISTYALGEIELECEFTYDYKSFAKGEKYKNRAIALAKEELGVDSVTKTQVKEIEKADGFIYEVTVFYKITVS